MLPQVGLGPLMDSSTVMCADRVQATKVGIGSGHCKKLIHVQCCPADEQKTQRIDAHIDQHNHVNFNQLL